MGLHYSGGGVFSSRLVCGDCGGYYGPKVWHSNSKYRRVVWQCNGKFSNEEKCRTPHLMEEDVKARLRNWPNGSRITSLCANMQNIA